MIAILHGMEVGLSPMQALQRIAVVNGRPTIWGDGALALVQASGLAEEVSERIDGDGPDTWIANCEVLRRGSSLPTIRRFSVDDARRARLWGKQGPWSDYPLRMLQMRARAFALRDAFADVLGGLYLREEIEEAWQESFGDAQGPVRQAPDPMPPTHADGPPDEAKMSGATGKTATAPRVLSQPIRAQARRLERRKAPPPPEAIMLAPVGVTPTGSRVPSTETGVDVPCPAETSASSMAPDGEAGSTSNGVHQSPPPTQIAPRLTANGIAGSERRRGPQARTALDLRYARHWSVHPPRSMPPVPAYRRRPTRARPFSHAVAGNAASNTDSSSVDAVVLASSDVATLYEDALSCAFDVATMEEIVEEFAARLAILDPEHRSRCDVITGRHARRIADTTRPSDLQGGHDV